MNGDSNNLMEQIKLYWTIQIITVGVLGYLVSNIDTPYSNKTFLISAVAYLLLTIGATYNFIGSYYTWAERKHLGIAEEKENLVAPLLGIIYCIICGILVALIFLFLLSILSGNVFHPLRTIFRIGTGLVGFLVGLILNWIIIRSILGYLFSVDKTQEYRRYTNISSRLFWIK